MDMRPSRSPSPANENGSSFATRASGALRAQRAVCRTPAASQRAVLADVLDQVAPTRFGRDHSLAAVSTMADLRASVPVRTYSDLRPYIDQIADGAPDVLTRSEPLAFLRTSGTSGNPKYIPTTEHWRLRYRGPALYAQWGLYFHLLGLEEITQYTAFDLSWERGGTGATSMHGRLPATSITQRLTSLGGADWTPPWYDAEWFTHVEGAADRSLFAKARLLAGRPVRLIVSVNPSKIVLLANVIAQHATEFIDDVRHGALRGERRRDLIADSREADRLESVLAQEGTLRLDHVWPQLGMLVCWTSGSAGLYRGWLEHAAPGVPIVPFSTTGTEGIVTLPVDAGRAGSALAVNQGLYEFAPVSDLGDHVIGEVHDLEDLEIGSDYRLVMSQANGILRYDTGDIYRMRGWSGRTPRMDFVSRAGNVSSFTGEKLTEYDIDIAMRRTALRVGAALPMYTVLPVWAHPPGYVAAVEYPEHSQNVVRHSAALDDELRAVNIEYDDKRSTSRLRPVRIMSVRPGTFARIQADRVARGTSPAQIKHLWLQQDHSLLAELREQCWDPDFGVDTAVHA